MTRSIEVEVWSIDGSNPLVFEGTLASDSNRVFFDDLNDVGSWSLEVQADHADEGLLQHGRLVRFKVDGAARGWGIVEGRPKVLADPQNRAAGRVVKVSGRGALALLEEGTVYPELGLGRVSPSTRARDWTASDFYDADWDNAVELKAQNDPDDTKPWFGAPQGWRDHSDDSKWVGPVDGDVPGTPTPGGFILLRGTYTVPTGAGGEYVADATADDGFVLSRDAEQIGAEQGAGMWGITRTTSPFILDEGSHQFAAKVLNFDRPDNSLNAMAFILSIFKMEGGGAILGDVVGRASAGTKMLAFPDAEPGFTPGQHLASLIEECLDRGALIHVEEAFAFSDNADSANVDWPAKPALILQVGSNLLEVARKLVAQKACDISVNPSTLVAWGDEFLSVQLWVAKGTDKSADVTLAIDVNVGAEEVDQTPPGPNTLLARTAEGRWLEVGDASAATAYRRREAPLSLGDASSVDAATTQAQAELDDHAEPADVITLIQVEVAYNDDGTIDTSNTSFPVPWEHFITGDTVTAPGYDGSATSVLVTGIHLSEDAAGKPIFKLDLEEVTA